MTLFEYLAAGYVLMLSFAVLRAISGVPHAARAPQRYWVHLVMLANALGVCLIAFWAFWPYRHVEWTIGSFMVALAIPAGIYAWTTLLVPTDPSAVGSWREHYYAVRTQVYATVVVLMSVVTFSNQFILGASALHASQIGNYVFLSLFAVGLVSARPRVHAVLVLALSATQVTLFALQFTDPDAIFGVSPGTGR